MDGFERFCVFAFMVVVALGNSHRDARIERLENVVIELRQADPEQQYPTAAIETAAVSTTAAVQPVAWGD